MKSKDIVYKKPHKQQKKKDPIKLSKKKYTKSTARTQITS